jgi:signal transduction histidine kinase/ActR/RegA family two-component response regulator
MMTTYDMDRNGLPYRTLVVVQELSESLDIPVFGNTDTLPPNGALGGSITSAASYARAAYDVTLKMLDGETTSGFANVETDYLFNGAQLDRFNIDRSLLPPGSEIIQEPFNFWRDYGLWIWIATAVMAVQFLLIGLLWAARQRSRKAEAKLREASKMEALGVLAGGVAHDFNNILMAISANTELATMQLGDDEKVREKLARIESASDRAEHLVGQILLFSRQSRQQERQAVQLCKLMDDSVDHIRQIMPPGCQISLQCDLPGVVLQADANQLHQVVMNLCINAQHAMDNHGVVEVLVEYSKLEAQQNFLDQTIPAGNYITLRIADSGSGIEAEDLKHIFEPFYTTKPSGKGTGLGLALVYQIVKAHNGYIDIRSEPGQGTEVTVYLHPSDETPNHNATVPGVMLQGNNERLLLVDDDYMVLDANRQSLETLGYQVTAYSSSVAALQYAEDNPGDIDLLVTDLSMPEMDGVRLINNIRLVMPGLPCILCTGYLDALNTLNTPDLDDIQIIKKPFSMPEISSALKKALQQSASTEPG